MLTGRASHLEARPLHFKTATREPLPERSDDTVSPTATPTPGPSNGGRVRRTAHWLKEQWEQVQLRLSSMVLSDVPLVLIGTVVVLTAFGIIMVLSASSVEQISAGLQPYAQARSQGFYAVLGLLVMVVIGYFIPVRLYRNRLTLNLALGACAVLLLAVIFVGVEVGGNKNWISLGGIRIQPSEIAKPVMILWLALVFSRQGQIDRGRPAQTIFKALFPAALGLITIGGLILAGHDLGTALIYGLFFSTMLLAAKPSRITVVSAFSILGFAALALVVISPNRIERILNTFAFWRECVEASCDQANSGLAALATGGFWGVGLGQSRQKYNYLPEAHNDYIFAVIGEELGLLGSLSVLVLYGALIYCAMRIILRSSDLFIRFATIGLITWLVGQAMMNIAMVVGMMPVIGVPLPFVSYGGSSLISSLIGAGILIAFARQTPLQPIMGEESRVGNGSSVQKDAARRVKLGRLVAAEQEKISADPYNSGWTLEKFIQRFNLDRFASALAGSTTPSGANEHQSRQVNSRQQHGGSVDAGARLSPKTAHRSDERLPPESMKNSRASRPAGTAPAHPSARIQHAKQGSEGEQNTRVSNVTPSAPNPPKAQRESEPKIPAGLRTIKKAREVPARDSKGGLSGGKTPRE